jgi:phosphoribosylformylglycinamidine synthase
MGGIAGILSKNKRILGMMPHPERCTNKDLNLNDGEILFDSIITALQ